MIAGSGSDRPKNLRIRIHNTGPKFLLSNGRSKILPRFRNKICGSEKLPDFRDKILCLTGKNFSEINEFSKEPDFEISRRSRDTVSHVGIFDPAMWKLLPPLPFLIQPNGKWIFTFFSDKIQYIRLLLVLSKIEKFYVFDVDEKDKTM